MVQVEKESHNAHKELTFLGTQFVITGAANGIGEAISNEVTRLGSSVIGIDIIPKEGLQVADTTNKSQLEMVARNVSGSIDYLVLSAGITQNSSEISEEEKGRIFRVNVEGTKNSFETFKPLLNDNATVVFIGTDNPPSTKPVYAASKNDVEDYAAEQVTGNPNLRIITLKPGPINTDLFRQGKPPEIANQIIEEIGLEPSQFADIVGSIIIDTEKYPSGSKVRVYKNAIEPR